MFKSNYKNLAIQDYIEVLSDGGKVNVNLGNKEINLSFIDFNVGKGTYEQSVYHVYSTNMHNDAKDVGRNWKINIEQYILPYNAEYNLGYNEGDYIYIDENNIIHRFINYDINKYYEEYGNLILEKTSNGYKIKDENDNKKYFDLNGKIREIRIQGPKAYISKVIDYDKEGRISRYYDSRCAGSKERYISFTYNASKLFKMSYINKGQTIEEIYYEYENDNLKGFYRYSSDILKEFGYFRYDTLNQLVMVTGTSNQAIKIDYNNDIRITTGVAKIKLANNQYLSIESRKGQKINYLNDELYLGDMVNIFKNVAPVNITSIQKEIESFTPKNNGSFTIKYDAYYTDVIEESGIQKRYYKNKLGKITSLFEVKGNKLLTLNQDQGYPLQKKLDEGSTLNSINRKQILEAKLNQSFNCITSTNIHDSLANNKYRDYFGQCIGYAHNYIVSFYVKHMGSNVSYVRAYVKGYCVTSDVQFLKEVNIDEKAYGAWQYVEIPFSVCNSEDAKFGIQYLNVGLKSNSSEKYYIADVRIRPALVKKIYIIDENNYILKDVSDAYKVKLKTKSGNKEIVLENENYITHKDILRSLINKDKTTPFDFIYCNGQKRIPNVDEIEMQTEQYSGKTRKIVYPNLRILKQDYANKNETKYDINWFDNQLYVGAHKQDKLSHTISDNQGRIIYQENEEENGISYEYDDYGNLLSTTIASKNAFDEEHRFKKEDSSGNQNKRFYLMNVYDNNQFDGINRENVVAIKNENFCVKKEYNQDNLNEPLNCISGKVKEAYRYDELTRIANIENDGYINHISYNSLGLIDRVMGNKNEYTYEYDEFGKIKQVNLINGSSKISLCNILNDSSENKVEYENCLTKSVKKSYYDNYGRLIREYDETSDITIEYQNQDSQNKTGTLVRYADESSYAQNVSKITDSKSGAVTTMTYDINNDKKKLTTTLNGNMHLEIEKETPVISKYNVGNLVTKRNKSYKDDIKRYANLREDNTEIPKFTYTYEYDDVVKNVSKRYGGNSIVEYDYCSQDNSNYLNNFVQALRQVYGGRELKSKFMYDTNANLIWIKHEGYINSFIAYKYDNLNRIDTEYHPTINLEYEYQYNEFNRIKKVIRNGEVYKEYFYDNLGRLVKCNKNGRIYKEYTYLSNNLNPKSVKIDTKEKAFVFAGNGKLMTYGDNHYEYDYLGLRLSKTNYGGTTTYYYNNEQLLGEDLPSGEKLRYMYDLNNEIVGVRHHKNNGNIIEYEYVKDNTGSIIAVVMDTNVVAKYEYDAYGNIISIYEDSNDDFAKLNPIRYKGYYYDIETRLYYLQSRYYDPEIGAFISPDSVEYLDYENIGGLNLYTYCNNNPVMYSDGDGHFAIISFLVGLGISSLIGATVGAGSYAVGQVVNYFTTGEFSWSWGGFLGATIGGGIGGALTFGFGISGGALGAFLSGAITECGTMIGENISDNAGYSAGDILINSAVVGIFSALCSGIMNGIKIKSLNAGRGSWSAVNKQIITKLHNGSISRITGKTFGKMLGVAAYSSIASIGVDEVYGYSGTENWILNFF